MKHTNLAFPFRKRFCERVWVENLLSRFEKPWCFWMGAGLSVFLGAGLVCLGSQISISFYPVPVTGQSFFVMAVGLFWGPLLGPACIALYLAMGAAGWPVFSDGKFGLEALVGASGGFLWGFLPVAWYCGRQVAKGAAGKALQLAKTLFFAHVLLFACGLSGLWLYFGSPQNILNWGFYPFLPGALLKGLILFGLTYLINRSMKLN